MRWIAVGIFLLLLSPLSWYTVMLIEDKTYQRVLACKALSIVVSGSYAIDEITAKVELSEKKLYCFDRFSKGN